MNRTLRGIVQDSLEGLYDIVVEMNENYLELQCRSEKAQASHERGLVGLQEKHAEYLEKLIQKWDERFERKNDERPESGERSGAGLGDSEALEKLNTKIQELNEKCDEIQDMLVKVQSTVVMETQGMRDSIEMGGLPFDPDVTNNKSGHEVLTEHLMFIECELRAIKVAVADVPSLGELGEVEDDMDCDTLFRKVDAIHRKLGKEKRVDSSDLGDSGIVVGNQRRIMEKLEVMNEKEDKIVGGIEEMKVSHFEMMDRSVKKLEAINEKEEKIVRGMEDMRVYQVEMMDRSVGKVGDPILGGAIARIHEQVVELKTKLAPTYAEMAARQREDKSVRNPMPVAGRKYSVIVRSTAEQDSAGEVEEKIKSTLEPRRTKIRLQAVRKIKDCKVLLTCGSQEEMEKVENQIRGNKELIVERAKGKDPLVLLKNLVSSNTEADIIESLRGQNAEMWTDFAEGAFRASERYRRRARNQNESMVVLQVSPDVWTRLTSAGKVHIDMQYVNVCDQSPLVQCTRCLGYGHGRRQCKEEEDCCSHCGGPHLRADCPQYAAGTIPQCKNCGEGVGKWDTAHNALSGDCPTRKKWDALARASYDYCA